MTTSSALARLIAVPQRAARRYFACRVAYPQELPSIMRKHIYTGMMGSVYFTLIAGICFVYFGNTIGLSRFQWGLMAGVSSFLLSTQLLSAMLTQRSGRRKFIWFWFAVAGRAMRFVGIVVSLCLWQAGWQRAGIALIIAVCLSNLFGAMSLPPWMSWLADIIPERQHGGFWGRRSALIGLAVIGTVIPVGLLMDSMPPERKLATIMIVFTCAAFIGFVDLFIHGTIPEPPMALPKRRRRLEQLLAPFRDRAFRPWLTFNACWTFAMTLGGSLAYVYFVDDLGFKKNFLGGMIVLTALPVMGGVITGPWSGRLIDRVGSKKVLFWGHLLWGTLPAFWVFASPQTALILLSCSSIIGGTSSTAALNAAIKLITRMPKPQDRAMYVAVSSCLGSAAGGLGALTAGTVLKVLGDWQMTVWGWTFVAFHLLFIASLCLRLGSALVLIRRVKDPEPDVHEQASAVPAGESAHPSSNADAPQSARMRLVASRSRRNQVEADAKSVMPRVGTSSPIGVSGGSAPRNAVRSISPAPGGSRSSRAVRISSSVE